METCKPPRMPPDASSTAYLHRLAPYRFVDPCRKPIVRYSVQTLWGNDTLDRDRLPDRTEGTGYNRIPFREYRNRFCHYIRQREKRSARIGQRAYPWQRAM